MNWYQQMLAANGLAMSTLRRQPFSHFTLGYLRNRLGSQPYVEKIEQIFQIWRSLNAL